MRSISRPAGKAARKYPPKKATWMKEDWKSVRPNASRKRGMRISLRLTPKAHKKNNPVMSAKGARNRRSVKGAGGRAEGGRAELVMRLNSSQSTVEVGISAIHKDVLPGGVTGKR